MQDAAWTVCARQPAGAAGGVDGGGVTATATSPRPWRGRQWADAGRDAGVGGVPVTSPPSPFLAPPPPGPCRSCAAAPPPPAPSPGVIPLGSPLCPATAPRVAHRVYAITRPSEFSVR